jgi:hypothetical protein
MDSTCLLRSYMILSWEGTYCPSFGELYEFDMRRHVLSITWGDISFWPEKTPTVHHLGSSMILTWEGTYCPSYVPSQVKMIELPRWWTVRVFSCQNHRALQMMDSTCLLRSKSYSSPDDRQLGSYMILTWEDTYCPSSGELYDFDLWRHILSIIWGALWFWLENKGSVHHLECSMIMTWEGTYCPSSTCLLRWKSNSFPDDRQYVLSHVKIK